MPTMPAEYSRKRRDDARLEGLCIQCFHRLAIEGRTCCGLCEELRHDAVNRYETKKRKKPRQRENK